jgi:hypothetical protein
MKLKISTRTSTITVSILLLAVVVLGSWYLNSKDKEAQIETEDGLDGGEPANK